MVVQITVTNWDLRGVVCVLQPWSDIMCRPYQDLKTPLSPSLSVTYNKTVSHLAKVKTKCQMIQLTTCEKWKQTVRWYNWQHVKSENKVSDDSTDNMWKVKTKCQMIQLTTCEKWKQSVRWSNWQHVKLNLFQRIMCWSKAQLQCNNKIFQFKHHTTKHKC